MGNTQWGDAEEAALDYLPHEAQVLYLRGLRRFMDYETGIVGISRRINRKGLIELLEVHPPPGSHRDYKPITPNGLRALLATLTRAGLIERVKGYERTLVFRLSLASVGYFDSMRNNRGTTEEQPNRSTSLKPRNDANSGGRNNRGTTEEQPNRSAPHQVSGIRDKEVVVVSAVSPGARVDPELHTTLLECFSGIRQMVDAQSVQTMLEEWTAMEVCPEDVQQVYRAVKKRDPLKSFSPGYLAGPMKDHKAGMRVGEGPEWANLPAGGGHVLMNFAKAHGFPGPGQLTDPEYRKVLKQAIHNRMVSEGMA